MEEETKNTNSTDQSIKVKWLTRTAVLLALTLAVQMVGLPQPFTGPLVNAMLLLSGIFVGVSSGILIGLLTPGIAFMRGILPAPLGPMIPFIMLGNGILVAIFNGTRSIFKSKRFPKKLLVSVIGLLIGATAKFLVLSSAVKFIVQVPPKIAQAMQTPQFITAMTGGIIAIAIEGVLTIALTKRIE